jgi:uncharacterized RDD family membrane protein YckC
MADYYELLGVDRGATKEQIRQAYQSRRNALSGASADDERRELGRLNEAWQTLADPYQRGRYDARLESDGGGEDLDLIDADDEPPVQERPRRRGLFEPRDGDTRRPAPAPEPTITLPAGAKLAEQRSRLNAMLFDVAILILLLVLVGQLAGSAIVNSMYPDETDRLEVLSDQIAAVVDVRDAQDEVDDLEQRLSDAEDADEPAAAVAAIQEDLDAAQDDLDDARTGEDTGDDFAAAIEECTGADVEIEDTDAPTADELEACDDHLTGEASDLNSELLPVQLAVAFAVVIVMVAYLVGFGLRSGQTLGKRLRHIKVVQVDGSPLRFSSSLVRYALPVVVAVLFAQFLGPIGFLLAIVGVLMWMRNPNRQGVHDRMAKTIVVEA